MFTTEITADTRSNTIQLLRRSKEILKALHEVIGMDFCESYSVIRVDGSFTINKLLKAAESAKDLNKSLIAGLLFGGANSDPYLFTLSSGGNLTVDLPYHNCFEQFYTKGEFHKYRTYKENITYLVIQRNNLIKPEQISCRSRADHADQNIRYIPVHPDGHINCDDTIDVTIPHLGGKTARIFIDYRAKTDKKPLFDKNGYPLWIQRGEQESKLRQLKADKATSEVAKVDFSPMIIRMETRINEVKALLIDRLSEANTWNNVYDVGKAISWHYSDAVSELQDFREHAESRTFRSIDHANGVFDRCLKKCNAAEAVFAVSEEVVSG